MNYYQNANKRIFRRYRMIRKVIWCLPYVNLNSFTSNIAILISAVYTQMRVRYKNYSCLLDLNIYYRNLCLEEMHERIILERCISYMHKRFKLSDNIKEVL